MSIYYAHEVVSGRNVQVSPAVKERGLNLLRAKPCDVHVNVIASTIQPGYACYVENLPAFMAATYTNRVTYMGNRGYPLGNVQPKLPWLLPPFIYEFSVQPTAAQKQELQQHSRIVTGKTRSVSFVLERPTAGMIRDLAKRGLAANTLATIGTVNIEGMGTVRILQRILSQLLLTHAYPAYRHTDDLEPAPQASPVTARKRRKVEKAGYVACLTKPEENVENPNDEAEGEMAPTQAPDDYVHLTYAKPTPARPYPWGSADHIPNASGVYVPYVRPLSVPDSVTVPRFISTRMIRCLAENPQGMNNEMTKLTRTWGMVSTTELGQEITHMVKCIDIALHAQAAVYPVYTGTVYEGCVIYGTGYSLGVGGVLVRPIAYDQLLQMVRKSSTHAKALEDIVNVLPDGVDIDAVCAASSLRELGRLVGACELDGNARRAVVDAASLLSYPVKYWSTSNDNVRRAMELLASNEEIPDDVPIHPKYILTTDRVESVLAAFGYQSFSFLIPNAPKCVLTMKTPPEAFHTRTVAVEAAVNDMRFVLENGYVTNNLKTLSAKHRDVPVRSTAKADVWRLLQECHSAYTNVSGAVETIGNTHGATISDDLW